MPGFDLLESADTQTVKNAYWEKEVKKISKQRMFIEELNSKERTTKSYILLKLIKVHKQTPCRIYFNDLSSNSSKQSRLY